MKNPNFQFKWKFGFFVVRLVHALMGESPQYAKIVGNVLPNSKGVHCKVESEGSSKQISGPTD